MKGRMEKGWMATCNSQTQAQVIKAPNPPKKDHTCNGPHLNGFEKPSQLQQPKYKPDSAHCSNCKIREHVFPAVINTLISTNHWHYQKAFTIAKSKNVCNPSIELSQRLPCELFRGKRFIRYATEYKNKACMWETSLYMEKKKTIPIFLLLLPRLHREHSVIGIHCFTRQRTQC